MKAPVLRNSVEILEMNELNTERNYAKQQTLGLDHELDLQDCLEEFDRIIYQIPEEFTLNSDSNENLSSEFTFNIGDGDGG